MDGDSEGEYKTSKYNSAVQQLIRLDDLWKDCHKHSRSGLYVQWNSDLDKIWAELAADLKPNCKEEEEFNKFTEDISKQGTLTSSTINGFSNPAADYYAKRSKHYMILLNKEIWLRRLQNNLGKGTSYADEFADDFE